MVDSSIPLQAYVCPVCIFRLLPGEDQAQIIKLLGTSFLIGSEGYYVTASHVLDNIPKLEVYEFVGLCIKSDESYKSNGAAKILISEGAGDPFDISLGKIDPTYKFNSPIKKFPEETKVLLDVCTFGYPDVAANKRNDFWGIGVRVHKGYIQRIIGDGTLPNEDAPHRYETNFLIGSGMSGSPLLDTRSRLIGVCVGSERSEIIEDQLIEINNDGSKYVEKRLKVQEHGISQSISPLIEWRPVMLNGKSLGEIF